MNQALDFTQFRRGFEWAFKRRGLYSRGLVLKWNIGRSAYNREEGASKRQCTVCQSKLKACSDYKETHGK